MDELEKNVKLSEWAVSYSVREKEERFAESDAERSGDWVLL